MADLFIDQVIAFSKQELVDKKLIPNLYCDAKLIEPSAKHKLNFNMLVSQIYRNRCITHTNEKPNDLKFTPMLKYVQSNYKLVYKIDQTKSETVKQFFKNSKKVLMNPIEKISESLTTHLPILCDKCKQYRSFPFVLPCGHLLCPQCSVPCFPKLKEESKTPPTKLEPKTALTNAELDNLAMLKTIFCPLLCSSDSYDGRMVRSLVVDSSLEIPELFKQQIDDQEENNYLIGDISEKVKCMAQDIKEILESDPNAHVIVYASQLNEQVPICSALEEQNISVMRYASKHYITYFENAQKRNKLFQTKMNEQALIRYNYNLYNPPHSEINGYEINTNNNNNNSSSSSSSSSSGISINNTTGNIEKYTAKKQKTFYQFLILSFVNVENYLLFLL